MVELIAIGAGVYLQNGSYVTINSSLASKSEATASVSALNPDIDHRHRIFPGMQLELPPNHRGVCTQQTGQASTLPTPVPTPSQHQSIIFGASTRSASTNTTARADNVDARQVAQQLNNGFCEERGVLEITCEPCKARYGSRPVAYDLYYYFNMCNRCRDIAACEKYHCGTENDRPCDYYCCAWANRGTQNCDKPPLGGSNSANNTPGAQELVNTVNSFDVSSLDVQFNGGNCLIDGTSVALSLAQVVATYYPQIELTSYAASCALSWIAAGGDGRIEAFSGSLVADDELTSLILSCLPNLTKYQAEVVGRTATSLVVTLRNQGCVQIN